MKQEIKTIANIIDGINSKKYQFRVFEKKTMIGGGEFKQNNDMLLNTLKYTRRQIQKNRQQMKAFQVLQRIQNNEVLSKYDSQDVKNKSLKGLVDCYILINSKIRKHSMNSLYHEEAKYKSYWQKLTEYVCESRSQNSYEQKINIYKESINNLKYLISESCYLNGYTIQNQVQSFHQKAQHSINYIGKQLGKYLGGQEQNSYNLNNINNLVQRIIKNQSLIDSDMYMMKTLSWDSFRKKFRDFNKDNKVHEIVSETLEKIKQQKGYSVLQQDNYLLQQNSKLKISLKAKISQCEQLQRSMNRYGETINIMQASYNGFREEYEKGFKEMREQLPFNKERNKIANIIKDKEYKPSSNQLSNSSLFAGQILNKKEKQYLKQVYLQANPSKKAIKSTALIYLYPTMKAIQLNSLIQTKQSYVVIMQLGKQNKLVIPLPQCSFMCSIQKKKVFDAVEKHKVIVESDKLIIGGGCINIEEDNIIFDAEKGLQVFGIQNMEDICESKSKEGKILSYEVLKVTSYN